jgi:hypothetical protein
LRHPMTQFYHRYARVLMVKSPFRLLGKLAYPMSQFPQPRLPRRRYAD